MHTLLPLFKEFRSKIPEVSEREIALYERHFILLQQWNEHIALVSRKSIEQSFAPHYIDSLHICTLTYRSQLGTFFDIGSGAGFPGIIFGIRYPEQEITLYEKSPKKQNFLTAVVAQLGLENISIGGLAPDRFPEGIVMGRAVYQREELFRFMKKRLASKSRFVLNSGGSNPDRTIAPGFEKIVESEYTLPLSAGNRRVEIFEKK